MNFVFVREYVTSGGKGFLPGQELPDGVLSKEQVDRLVAAQILLQQIPVGVFASTLPAEEVDEIEELDPEKTIRKPRRK